MVMICVALPYISLPSNPRTRLNIVFSRIWRKMVAQRFFQESGARWLNVRSSALTVIRDMRPSGSNHSLFQQLHRPNMSIRVCVGVQVYVGYMYIALEGMSSVQHITTYITPPKK